jgi:hypothetical protein
MTSLLFGYLALTVAVRLLSRLSGKRKRQCRMRRGIAANIAKLPELVARQSA